MQMAPVPHRDEAARREGNLEGSVAAASLLPMTGRRAVPLLVGLWAASAGAQTQTAWANYSEAIDSGVGPTRAYVITSAGTEYVAASAGADIRFYSTVDGSEIFSRESGSIRDVCSG